MSDPKPSVVVKSLPVQPQKLLSHKSKLNIQRDENQQKKYLSGISEFHKISENSSGIIKIAIEDSRNYVPVVSLQCKDSDGGISCVIVSSDPNVLSVCLENILDQEREVRVNYVVFF